MKRTSRSGATDPAVLDEEGAVARHAGEQHRALVDRAHVPEPGHVDPALDRRHRAPPRRPRRRRRARGSWAPARRRSRPARARGRSSARRRRRCAAERVSWTTAWATPSWMSGQRRFGTPSASKARGSVPAKRGESDEVDRRRDDALAQAPDTRAAALGVGEPVEGPRAEERRAACRRRRREHDRVLAGLELRGSSAVTFAAASSATAPASRSSTDGAVSAAKPLRPSGVARDDLHEGVGHGVEGAHARSSRRSPSRTAPRSRSRRPRAVALGAGAEARPQRRAPAFAGRAARCRGSQPSWARAGAGVGQAGVRRRALARGRGLGGRARAPGDVAQAVVVDVRSSRPGDVARRATQSTETDSVVDLAWPAWASSARSARAASARGSTVAWASPARALRARARRARWRLGVGHATPTWTSRKRAGAAPWETSMTWPGSPLPQFSAPHSRHSGASRPRRARPRSAA